MSWDITDAVVGIDTAIRIVAIGAVDALPYAITATRRIGFLSARA